jgi:hypothetical protein
MLPSPPLTEPDVQISHFRFFTGELRSQRCSDGRSSLLGEGADLVTVISVGNVSTGGVRCWR